MKNLVQIMILFLLTLMVASCRSDRNKAITNFEQKFEEFHAAYPADKGTYHFQDYSKLEEVKEDGQVVGYTQKTTAVRTGPDGEITENPITIIYDLEFEVEYF